MFQARNRQNLLFLALLTFSTLSLVPPAGGQTPLGSGSPRAPLLSYYDTIVHPALEGKVPADGTLRSFYTTTLSIRTRALVNDDQFADYWKRVASRFGRLGYNGTVKYVVGEPIPEDSAAGSVQNESADQARISVTVTTEYHPSVGHYLFAFIGDVVALAIGIAGCAFDARCQPPGSGYWPEGTRSTVELYYTVVREGETWKLVLSADETAEMQKLPSHVAVKRYGPNTTASNSGLTLRVIEATLGKDTTTLRLSLQNAGGTEARVLNALSLATLTDDSGATHDTRILRSTFPETVPAGTSALVTLVFEPAPLDSKKLLLALSGIRMGEEEFPLAVDIVLVAPTTPPQPPAPSPAGPPALPTSPPPTPPAQPTPTRGAPPNVFGVSEQYSEVRKGDIVYTLSSNKVEYGADEGMDLTFRITNVGKEDATLVFPTGQLYDFVIKKGPTEIARWSGGQTLSQQSRNVVLGPGKALGFRTRWLQKDMNNQIIAPGQYEITAIFLAKDNEGSVTLSFERVR